MATREQQQQKYHDFTDAVSRAIHATRVHPQIRCSERLKLLEELKDCAVEDAVDAFTNDAKAKRKCLAQDDASEVGPLANVTEEQERHHREYFDLNDEHPSKLKVDLKMVTQIVLDETSETLRQRDSEWETWRNPVRRVLYNKQREAPEPAPGSVLTRTEMLWHDLIRYQQTNPWERSQRAASLAGRLLLIEWEQKGQYTRVRKTGGIDAWEFPERFFGGIYSRDMRRLTGNKLKPLYETHCALVKAAVKYAVATRDRMLEMNDVAVRRTRKATDPTVLSMETKADHLVLRFFPWVGPSYLGLATNICTWNHFQKDLQLFADVYDTYWYNRPVAVGSDGLIHELPDIRMHLGQLNARTVQAEKNRCSAECNRTPKESSEELPLRGRPSVPER